MTEEQVFAAAIAIPSADKRTRYVQEACGDDEQLKANVFALLEAHDQPDDLLDGPGRLFDPPADTGATVDLSASDRNSAGGKSHVGPYKLLQVIGEGGFGVVYMAEQMEPITRRVALKIIKPGMDTKEVVARFEAERQALAMMDHPNIAKVFGGGTTDCDHPYFVMELVKGVPITEYCDDNCLDIQARLRLFISVCHAVQHAHQKGVIHRDLKPSNVLVAEYDDVAVPKIIDFGVAKALNQRLTERTIFTQFGQVIGTVQYMSPEQSKINQLDIDTRSDIYSLGVILYELLTGTTPIDAGRLRTAALDEMMRLVREEEPMKPSTRIGSSSDLPSVAKRRQVEPRRLSLVVRGDLDWITMKALDKERSRRYSTANDLATDCEHFLHNDPVSASPPSLIYRTRKFVHRNRGAVIATTLGVCFLLVSLGLVIRNAQATASWFKAQFEETLRKQAEDERLATEEDLRKEKERRLREVKLHNADIPEVERLLGLGDFNSAFKLAESCRAEFPNDAQLQALRSQVASQWVVETIPAGAQVFLRPYGTKSGDWGPPIGKTPLNIGVAKGFYHWRISQDGLATLEGCAGPESVTITRKMDPVDRVPPDMVLVLGSAMPNIGRDYFIDRTEATNKAFQEFVDAGGYKNRSLWKYPFFEGGQQIDWQAAMQKFVDRTQSFGPADWSNGRFPDGQGDYPVTGISWYEAAAYAAFKNKELPTIHHWKAASGNSIMNYIVPASNFRGGPPAPVGSHPGVGPFGTVDTAGNVSEWCLNGSGGPEHRHIMGGASSDPDYMFNVSSSALAMRRDPHTGFRCAKYIESPSPDLLTDTTIPIPYHLTAKPVNDEKYESLRRQFDYAKGPLNAVVRDGEDCEIWHEKIVTVDAAYNGRLDIHIYAPKTATKNHQVLIVFPGTGAFKQDTFYPEPYCFQSLERLIELGRTIVWPVYAGMYHRNKERFSSTADAYIRPAQDMCRALDYLQQSEDYSTAQVGYIGYSMGGNRGPIHVAVEKRFSLGIFVNGGFNFSQDAPPPEIDPVNFAPRIAVPILMINGRDDSVFPYETSQAPMFDALRLDEEHKKRVTIPNAGHGVDPNLVEREVIAWLDKYLDPVSATGVDDPSLTINRLERRAKRSMLQDDFAAAEATLRELATALKNATGEGTPEYLRANSDLAFALARQEGKSEEAERVCSATYEAQSRLLGDKHADTRKTRWTSVNIGLAKAWAVFQDAGSDKDRQLALQNCRTLKATRPDLALATVPLAWGHYRVGDDSQAWTLLDEAAVQPGSWWASWYLRGILKFKEGCVDESIAWYRVAECWEGADEGPMKREAKKVLGGVVPVTTTSEQLADAFDTLIRRYPQDYNLPLHRGVKSISRGNVTAAHADLATAFDVSRSKKQVDLETTDWYALVCQLTGDLDGLRRANEAAYELVDEIRGSDRWRIRDFVLGFCRSPHFNRFDEIKAFAMELFGDVAKDVGNGVSLIAARNIAEFRSGADVEVFPVLSEYDVERSLYSLYFRVLTEIRRGNRKGAVVRLDEAMEFTKNKVPSPDGPDFKWSNRAHAWAVSQVLLAEARQALELGSRDLDQETVRVVTELRQRLQERLGEQLTRQMLFRVGSALVEAYGGEADSLKAQAGSENRSTTGKPANGS